MATATARSYLSPTLVLLAFDWSDGAQRKDFLGFAIKRTPGFAGHAADWLPNRIGFDGPPADQHDLPSSQAPIQKFMWWDARFGHDDIGKTFRYDITPVVGTPPSLTLVGDATVSVPVVIPPHVEHDIGTWFNRAVVSSQAFSRLLDQLHVDPTVAPPPAVALQLRAWLANGLETVVPDFMRAAPELVGAIYHLTDDLWIEPALRAYAANHDVELVYDAKTSKNSKTGKVIPSPNQPVVDELKQQVTFKPRNKTNIMHDKFLVSGNALTNGGHHAPARVLCGSANFTTEGLTSQANLLHTFDAPDLAALYLQRESLLATNPTLGKTSAGAGWSDLFTVGDAGVRVFFSPEPGEQRESINTIVEAIHAAQRSVVFCLFMPTDEPLRDACFAAGDNGKMMFGLVNHVTRQEPTLKTKNDGTPTADSLASLELFHRSRDQRDVIGAEYFSRTTVPAGFEPEVLLFPGEKDPGYAPVIIHHKFVVIDAETETPRIFSGSANMSGNSLWHNDENLLDIRGSKRLAAIYLAEFLRLYEHYRARAAWIRSRHGNGDGFRLTRDAVWAAKHFRAGTPEYKARLAMATWV